MNDLQKKRKSLKKWRAKIKSKERIKTLFIAESPPKNKKKYFYFEKNQMNSYNLSYYLFNALKIFKKDKSKEECLKEFVAKSYFLIDAIDERPKYGKWTKKGRKQKINANIERINREIRKFNPEKIIVIGKMSYYAMQGLLKARTNVNWVYFPTNRNDMINKFNKKLRRML